MRRRLILVGERFNQRRFVPTCCQRAGTRCPDHVRHVRLLERLGAFRHSRPRKKLATIGVPWDTRGINLTFPDERGMPFDRQLAANVAWVLANDWLVEPHVMLLCGRRVQSAFRVWASAPEYGEVTEAGMHTYVALPHPSGLCRVWNDPVRTSEVRSVIQELLEECQV